MPIPTLKAHAFFGGPAGGGDFTSTAIDTTGANFVAALLQCITGGAFTVLTDSKGNDWNVLTLQDLGAGAGQTRIVYTSTPASCGAGHTFTVNGGQYKSMCVAAFDQILVPAGNNPFDVQNGVTNSSGTSHQAGSITPTVNGELILFGVGGGAIGGTTYSPPAGFSITDQAPFTSGQYFESALAWMVQTTAGAFNPAMTSSQAVVDNAVIASFKPTVLAPVVTFVPKRKSFFYRPGDWVVSRAELQRHNLDDVIITNASSSSLNLPTGYPMKGNVPIASTDNIATDVTGLLLEHVNLQANEATEAPVLVRTPITINFGALPSTYYDNHA